MTLHIHLNPFVWPVLSVNITNKRHFYRAHCFILHPSPHSRLCAHLEKRAVLFLSLTCSCEATSTNCKWVDASGQCCSTHQRWQAPGSERGSLGLDEGFLRRQASAAAGTTMGQVDGLHMARNHSPPKQSEKTVKGSHKTLPGGRSAVWTRASASAPAFVNRLIGETESYGGLLEWRHIKGLLVWRAGEVSSP